MNTDRFCYESALQQHVASFNAKPSNTLVQNISTQKGKFENRPLGPANTNLRFFSPPRRTN